MINLYALLTSSLKYPERALSAELTDEMVEDGADLVRSINALLNDLESKASEVSSGFRPASVNAATPNAAKASLHMKCLACDLLDDKDQSLAKLIASKPELLKKHNLWLEHPDSTKGQVTNWVHLDCSKTRLDRPVRIFKP
jgi:hypothetical protein